MEKKFITPEQKNRASNRVVLNFGILLAGALVLLYVYNFYASGYITQVLKVLNIATIVFAALAVVMFVLGMAKFRKLKSYSAIPFGAFLACGIISYLPNSPMLAKYAFFTTQAAIWGVFILMAVYFIIFAIVTGIYLKTHPVLVEKKKIQHKKKRK